MSDIVHELYTARIYPALSHPATHPARLAVAAKVGGVTGLAAVVVPGAGDGLLFRS